MRLSITTPRGAVVELKIGEVTAPGALGEFGVLPGHVPMVAALKPGVLTYEAEDGHKGWVAVGKGYLQVAMAAEGDRVLVLVDQAMPAATVDKAAAETELTGLNTQVSSWKGESDGQFAALVERQAWAQARVDAANRSAGSAH